MQHKLKGKVDAVETAEEKKDIIAQAGMELTDDELENVAGGSPIMFGRIDKRPQDNQ